jgi:hypothetical protein
VKRIFEQVTSCSCFECSKDLYIAVIRRQHNDFCFGKFSPNRDDGIQPVHLRHLQVHERDVRAMRTKLLDTRAISGSVLRNTAIPPLREHDRQLRESGLELTYHSCSMVSFLSVSIAARFPKYQKGRMDLTYALAPGIMSSISVPLSS